MAQTHHVEKHFTSSDFIRDVIIGMADGLTVPFALAAGLSGAVSATNIIVIAGVAEVAAGSIAMGLGGYLAARSDADHYENELVRERREVEQIPDDEAQEVMAVFHAYGCTEAEALPVVNSLRQRPEQWVDFMMRFELGLEKPDPKRALRSALTIAGAYIVGGFIPLLPYILMNDAHSALLVSVAFTITALGAFGAVKGHYTGMPMASSAIRTALIGGLAAAAAFGIAKAIGAK